MPLWSDALQDWLVARYRHAMPILEELADYAITQGVKVAIEPVRTGTSGSQFISDLLVILKRRYQCSGGRLHRHRPGCHRQRQCGHARPQMKRLLDAGRLHYVHLSAPIAARSRIAGYRGVSFWSLCLKASKAPIWWKSSMRFRRF